MCGKGEERIEKLHFNFSKRTWKITPGMVLVGNKWLKEIVDYLGQSCGNEQGGKIMTNKMKIQTMIIERKVGTAVLNYNCQSLNIISTTCTQI